MDPTCFKSRWATFARDRVLPDQSTDQQSPCDRAVAQLRRDALEFFSWGLVHAEAARCRLEELLPDHRPPVRTPDNLRLMGSREQGAGSEEAN